MDFADQSELIADYQAGCPRAFRALVECYQERLGRFLMTQGMNPDEVDDTLQLVFMAVHRYRERFDPSYRFTTWLYTIARREAGRTRARRMAWLPWVAQTANLPGPADTLDGNQGAANLWELARKTLSQAAYTALWLYYGEDFKVDEIATVMGKSPSWVKVNLHRSRKRLKAVVDDDLRELNHEH